MSPSKLVATRGRVFLLLCGIYVFIYFVLSCFGRYEHYADARTGLHYAVWEPLYLRAAVNSRLGPHSSFTTLGWFFLPLAILDGFIWHPTANLSPSREEDRPELSKEGKLTWPRRDAK